MIWKRTVLAFLIVESSDSEYKYVESRALLLCNDEGINTEINIEQDENIKGIINPPYPTYRVSVMLPNEESVDLGYEFPNVKSQDWFEKSAYEIDKLIEKTTDEKELKYLKICLDKCWAESEKYKPTKEKQLCKSHTIQIDDYILE